MPRACRSSRVGSVMVAMIVLGSRRGAANTWNVEAAGFKEYAVQVAEEEQMLPSRPSPLPQEAGRTCLVPQDCAWPMRLLWLLRRRLSRKRSKPAGTFAPAILDPFAALFLRRMDRD